MQAFMRSRATIFAEDLFGQVPEFAVYVEDGSIRLWLAVVGSLYIGIGGYGSFRSGIDYAVKDARTFSERVLQDVRNSGVPESEIRRFERRLGVPGKIRRMFGRFDRLKRHGRELSKTEYEREIDAIERGLRSIFRAVENKPDRDLILKNLLTEYPPRHPEQLPIPGLPQMPVVGLRPMETQLWKPRFRVLDEFHDEERTRKRSQEETLYRFAPFDSGFRLISE